jgi:hypothetical protein
MESKLNDLLPYLVPLATFAMGYGALHARIKGVEDRIDDTVSRREFDVMVRRLDELVTEMRGLRHDLISFMMKD